MSQLTQSSYHRMPAQYVSANPEQRSLLSYLLCKGSDLSRNVVTLTYMCANCIRVRWNEKSHRLEGSISIIMSHIRVLVILYPTASVNYGSDVHYYWLKMSFGPHARGKSFFSKNRRTSVTVHQTYECPSWYDNDNLLIWCVVNWGWGCHNREVFKRTNAFM